MPRNSASPPRSLKSSSACWVSAVAMPVRRAAGLVPTSPKPPKLGIASDATTKHAPASSLSILRVYTVIRASGDSCPSSASRVRSMPSTKMGAQKSISSSTRAGSSGASYLIMTPLKDNPCEQLQGFAVELIANQDSCTIPPRSHSPAAKSTVNLHVRSIADL